MTSILPDPSTPFGERVAQRLREERVIWLTTVESDGTPQPNPVWFYWDGESFLIYNLDQAKRLKRLRESPRVSLNFDSNGQGGDIVVFTGEARLSPDEPPADEHPEYLAKYREAMTRLFGSPAGFVERYPHAMRVVPDRVRG